MHQNRLLLLEGASAAQPDTAIYVALEHTLNLSQSAGRIWDDLASVENTLVLTHEALSIKPADAENNLALSHVISGIRRNPTVDGELVLDDDVATQVEYNRPLENTLVLSQSATGYLANRIENASCEDPIEGFTLEEI